MTAGFERLDTKIDQKTEKLGEEIKKLDEKFDRKIDKLSDSFSSAKIWALGMYITLAGSMFLRDRQERQVVLTRAGGKASAPIGSAPRLLQLAGIPQFLLPKGYEAVLLFLAGGVPYP